MVSSSRGAGRIYQDSGSLHVEAALQPFEKMIGHICSLLLWCGDKAVVAGKLASRDCGVASEVVASVVLREGSRGIAFRVCVRERACAGQIYRLVLERVSSRRSCNGGSKRRDHLRAATCYDHLNPSLTSDVAPVIDSARLNLTGVPWCARQRIGQRTSCRAQFSLNVLRTCRVTRSIP